jgi:hypothetical protein
MTWSKTQQNMAFTHVYVWPINRRLSPAAAWPRGGIWQSGGHQPGGLDRIPEDQLWRPKQIANLGRLNEMATNGSGGFSPVSIAASR